MASQGFTYAPIDTSSEDIRLLRLSDRYTPGPPSCEIFHASLKDDIKYEALSYTWGDPRLQDFISLNGNVASVTVNLTRALEDIRLEHGTRVLWVDALCVNQEDTRERNHQVKQMGAIYQKAERVVVWVGRPKSLKGANTASVLGSLEKSFELGLEYSAFQPNRKAKWLELTALCELPYWRRLWIVQEIALAAELHVYHGRSYKDWKMFSKIRKDVERAKKYITLHESLQGIAKTITESVPGTLDKQREYTQPPWLREMHAAMQHLFSRAEDAARAADILSEISDFLQKPSHEGSIPPTNSKQPNSSTKQSKFTIIHHTSMGFGRLIKRWVHALGQDPSYFSKEVLAFVANGDFERNEPNQKGSIVTIPCFLPLNAKFAEACENLPRHIKYVRAHEREGYYEELKNCYEQVLRQECYTNLLNLALETTSFRSDNQRFFQILSGKLEGEERKWKIRHDQLEESEKKRKLRLEGVRSRKMNLPTMPQDQRTHFEELEEELKKEELLYRSEVEKMELQLEEIQVMGRGLKYLNARYQEVDDYLEAGRKFDKALRDFSQSFESDA
jgi:hypothetical protein